MRLKTCRIATSVFLKFVTIGWDISKTIWHIEVNGGFFCTFYCLSYGLNLARVSLSSLRQLSATLKSHCLPVSDTNIMGESITED